MIRTLIGVEVKGPKHGFVYFKVMVYQISHTVLLMICLIFGESRTDCIKTVMIQVKSISMCIRSFS